MVLVGSVLAAALFAAAADDYKVIKNAVKSAEASAPEREKRAVVQDRGDRQEREKEKVKITLPVSLVEMMINACSEEKFQAAGHHEIDLRRVWDDLKKAGPLALVEIEDEGETVKIWFE